MIIKRAYKQDLPAVRALMQQYGKMVVDETLFNNHDVAVQARLDTGELVGFIWCGLMAKGSLGYVDKFCVDPKYVGKGLGNQLGGYLLYELSKKRVKSVFGLIKQDKYHEQSAMNALKLAMGAHDAPYTFVETQIEHSVQAVKELGESYGR